MLTIQAPPSGQGLAGVDDANARALHGIDEAVCPGCDAAHSHQEIQRRPFSGEDATQISLYGREDVSGLRALSIADQGSKLESRIDFAKHRERLLH